MSEHVNEDRFEARGFAGPSFWERVLGIFLPPVVLAIDPLVFSPGEASSMSLPISPVSPLFGPSALYVSAISSTITLATWNRQSSTPKGRALRAGWLIGGMVFALFIGIVLFPLAIIGLGFFGIGALGFTPFIAAYIYRRQLKSYPSWDLIPKSGLYFGISFHFIIILLLYCTEKYYIDFLLSNLEKSGIAEHRIVALYDISRYPFAFGHFDHTICAHQFPFDEDTTSIDQFATLFNEAMAVRYMSHASDMRKAMSAALGNANVTSYCYWVVRRALN